MKNKIPPILISVLLFSCSSGTDTKSTISSVDSAEVNTVKVSLDTITRMDQLKDNTSAIFKARNNQFYLVSSDEMYSSDDSINNVSESSSNKTMLASTTANPACTSNYFDGIDRKVAKIDISTGRVENFATLQDFLDQLMDDETIAGKITSTGETSNRVREEKRNIKIEKAWLYTFKRQTDEDYHLIIGTTSNINTAKFFNVEISGLPESDATDYDQIKNARDQFFDYFGFDENKCPAQSYSKSYIQKPFEVSVTGSMFFDKLHYQGNGEIGPSWARGDSYWEIHPITSLEFK